MITYVIVHLLQGVLFVLSVVALAALVVGCAYLIQLSYAHFRRRIVRSRHRRQRRYNA